MLSAHPLIAWSAIVTPLTFGFLRVYFTVRLRKKGFLHDKEDTQQARKRESGWSYAFLQVNSKLSAFSSVFAGVGLLSNARVESTPLLSALAKYYVAVPDWLRIAGALSAFAGLSLFVWVSLVLDDNWSPILQLKKDKKHTLITHGPYRLVRHPMYTSLSLLTIGYTLAASHSWVFVPTTLFLTAILLRIPKEEAMMRQEFPSEYPQYERRTTKLIPFVW